MSKILVADSEGAEREVARRSLSGAGYQVVLSSNADEVGRILKGDLIDMIVLAVNFPGSASFDLYRGLRRDPVTSSIPIILLSDKNDMGECVQGLELGAEDCISKPINPMELVLRTRKILNRSQNGGGLPRGESLVFTSGELTIDFLKRAVYVSGSPVHLTATEFSLLQTLSRKGGRAMSREQLLRELWGPTLEADSRTLDTHVRRLRAKLGSAGQVISTIHRFGYRLESDTK